MVMGVVLDLVAVVEEDSGGIVGMAVVVGTLVSICHAIFLVFQSASHLLANPLISSILIIEYMSCLLYQSSSVHVTHFMLSICHLSRFPQCSTSHLTRTSHLAYISHLSCLVRLLCMPFISSHACFVCQACQKYEYLTGVSSLPQLP